MDRSERHIVVVTGASGVGKTTAVQALGARAIPGVHCFHFDSIGVPSEDVMERDYGGGQQWQAWATAEWLTRCSGLPEQVRVAVLDGQTRPSVVVDLSVAVAPRVVHVVLLDCATDVRDARLRGPRQQAELASARMDSWAQYLRHQAEALKLEVINTTVLAPSQVADRLEGVIRQLLEEKHPGTAQEP